jgi:glucans biosynthesis protein
MGAPQPFSFGALRARAAAAAREPFVPRRPALGRLLDELDYAVHSKIRHRVENALFLKGPGAYRVTFFPLGRLFREPVRINVVEGGTARPVLYSPSIFDIPPGSPAEDMPRDAGFAGFRLHKPLDYAGGDGLGDFLAFLGASYFRASGPLSQYGLSARGLAVDVAPEPPRTTEEFPAFTEFWIEPRIGVAPRICAFLDGPSVTGAFRFQTRLQTWQTLIDVEADIHLRADVGRLGIAPLTSMYWFSERRKDPGADWRPEVHDSDGLALLTAAGERIWRPLSNPARVRVSSFAATGLRGFGLMQRDRNAGHYLDVVRFERRPSLWIEPFGLWPEGSVELVEIPTRVEYEDNIVAFFRPSAPARKGSRYRLRYRMRWIAADVHLGGLARCTATRLAKPTREAGAGDRPAETRRWLAVDWTGDKLGSVAGIRPAIRLSRGTLRQVEVERTPGQQKGVQVRFLIATTGPEPLHLRMVLKRGGSTLSETWRYTLDPDRGLIASYDVSGVTTIIE